MTQIALTEWTCNRCETAVTLPQQAPNGERAGLPDGWSHVDARHSGRHSGDLCPDCADRYRRWWRCEPTDEALAAAALAVVDAWDGRFPEGDRGWTKMIEGLRRALDGETHEATRAERLARLARALQSPEVGKLALQLRSGASLGDRLAPDFAQLLAYVIAAAYEKAEP